MEGTSGCFFVVALHGAKMIAVSASSFARKGGAS